MIGNKTDLGAVPQLWGKPQTYARFLGSELRFIYKDTLLVVMPQGFGINGSVRAIEGAGGARRHRSAQGPHATRGSRTQPTRRCARWPRRTASSSRAAAVGGGGLPLPLIAAGVMVLAGIGGGVLVLRGDRKPRSRKQARGYGRSAGVSASPGAGRSLQSTSTARLAERARALLALCGQPRPERARDGNGMAAAHAAVGRRHEAARRPRPPRPRGGSPRPPAAGPSPSTTTAAVQAGSSAARPDLQRRGHAALPVLVAHGARAVQIGRRQQLVGVRAEHDHAVAERRCGEGRERPLDERAPVDRREQLDAAARRAEARAGARGEQHAADHPGPRPAADASPRARAKRP